MLFFRPAKTGTGPLSLDHSEDFEYAVECAEIRSADPDPDAVLKAELGRMEDAFEEAEGRPPTEYDDEFWVAVNKAIDAHDRGSA